MENQATSKRKRGNLFWLLLLAVVVVAWWYFRPTADNAADPDTIAADRLVALDADPDDILVDLADDAGDDVIAALEREVGIDLILVSDQAQDERLFRAYVPPTRRDAVLAALANRPEVDIAEPDATVSVGPAAAVRARDLAPTWKGFPNDPKYNYQWHLRQIDMPGAWPLADGAGVIVAVIDTGVAYEDHERFHQVPDLAGVDFAKPYDFVDNDRHANDDHGHGTHVAGTVAQATHNGVGVAGVGRKVTIMPLKVLSANGSGSVGAIADAIHYAADEGAKVINMSLGGRFPSRVLKKAVAYAHDKGVVVVCAAGNDGRGKVSYPAAYPGAIAVAATQHDESTTFYSNWGSAIDIAAPGGNTQVDQNGDGMPDGVLQNTIAIGDPTRDDYFAYMGTSMASPHVAGVAALVVGQGVTDPKMVEALLKDTARGPADRELDASRYGAGIVDAKAAVTKARAEMGAWQLALGLLIAGGLASSVRRRGLLAVTLGPRYLVGVLVGASGLFFLPLLGSVGASVSSLPVLDALSRGLPSWDLAVLGPAGHGNPLFFSALIPLGLVALLYNARGMRAPLAGIAVGVAGHLLFHAIVRLTDIHYVPSSLMIDEAWLLLNAVACGFIARLVLRR
jgi:serine protease